MTREQIEHHLWVEKYRPKTIDDCILPESIKKTFKDMVAQGDFQNLMLCGQAGSGKTTVARALCAELSCEYMFINASEESGIDVLRTKIRTFASSVSLTDSKKVVILDEFDNASNAMQPALRGFIEEFAGNCRFIFTCNFKHKILDALHSRCTVIDFKIEKKDVADIGMKLFTRLKAVLQQENVTFKPEVLGKLIKRYFPDIRRCLNELQRYSVAGTIDEGILSHTSDIQVSDLIGFLKKKEFNQMRKWVGENVESNQTVVFRKVYESLNANMKPDSIPQAILILADYGYKSQFAVDQEINTVAALVEIMAECEWT